MFITKTIRFTIAATLAVVAFPAGASAIPCCGGAGGGNGEPPNQPPVAKLTISPNPALVNHEQVIHAQARNVQGGDFQPVRFGSPVKFDASASTDDDGISKYEFDLDGNGSYEVSGTTAIVSRKYTQAGSYHIQLRVTDDMGKKSITTRTLIVHEPPHAVLAADKTVALIGQQVAYSAAGSTDDNGIRSYEWDLDGDGTFETNTGTTPSATSSYTTLGTRTVKLRVTDIHGVTGQAQVDVVVHRAPTGAFSINPNPVVVGQAATFDASASSDDDPIAKYEWDLNGDGTFETDTQAVPTATMTYTTPGTVTVKLRITDDHGVQDVVSHDVTVNPAPVTTTTTTDTTAPLVTIAPKSAKLSKAGKVTLTIACPVGETTCTGRVDLRSLLGARSAALGGRTFTAAGGQTVKVQVQLSKKNRRLVRRKGSLKAQATALATDAAGNTGTSRARLVIHR